MSVIEKVPTWCEAEADATEAKADYVEAAILANRRLEGIFTKSSSVDKERVIYISLLEVESLNLRNLADRQRGRKKESDGS